MRACHKMAGDCPNFAAGTIAPMVAEQNGTGTIRFRMVPFCEAVL
jgi:hypothetical protein